MLHTYNCLHEKNKHVTKQHTLRQMNTRNIFHIRRVALQIRESIIKTFERVSIKKFTANVTEQTIFKKLNNYAYTHTQTPFFIQMKQLNDVL